MFYIRKVENMDKIILDKRKFEKALKENLMTYADIYEELELRGLFFTHLYDDLGLDYTLLVYDETMYEPQQMTKQEFQEYKADDEYNESYACIIDIDII